MGLFSLKFFWWALSNASLLQECVSAVQGHSRSLILIPIESAYTTSYYSVIVIFVLYAPFQVWQVLGFEPHPCWCLTVILRVFPLDQIAHVGELGVSPSRSLRYGTVKLVSKYSNLYVITAPERGRQTDRQTDDILWHNRALSAASRGKNLLKKTFKTVVFCSNFPALVGTSCV